MRRYPNGEREAFISVPDESVVLMNSIPSAALPGAKRVDSFIMVEKPHKDFAIHFQDFDLIVKIGSEKFHREVKMGRTETELPN